MTTQTAFDAANEARREAEERAERLTAELAEANGKLVAALQRVSDLQSDKLELAALCASLKAEADALRAGQIKTQTQVQELAAMCARIVQVEPAPVRELSLLEVAKEAA